MSEIDWEKFYKRFEWKIEDSRPERWKYDDKNIPSKYYTLDFDNDEIIAVIEWDNDECRFYLNTTDFFKDKYVTDYEIVKQEEYEVIGNIYENKELLESEG